MTLPKRGPAQDPSKGAINLLQVEGAALMTGSVSVQHLLCTTMY